MAPQASTLVTLGIPSLALVVFGLVALAIHVSSPEAPQRARRFALGAVAWLAVSAALALSGFLAHIDVAPPPMLAILIPSVGLPLALGFSRVGAALARALPLAWLVGFHAFRLPLELVMHQAALEGTMPEQMTFTGWNFDIVTGASAVVVAIGLARGGTLRSLLIAWNALGSFLLAAIIGIAIASLPRFHAFGTRPAELNTWVLYFPFIWLPAGLVACALFGHIVLWRRIAADARERP